MKNSRIEFEEIERKLTTGDFADTKEMRSLENRMSEILSGYEIQGDLREIKKAIDSVNSKVEALSSMLIV